MPEEWWYWVNQAQYLVFYSGEYPVPMEEYINWTNIQ